MLQRLHRVLDILYIFTSISDRIKCSLLASNGGLIELNESMQSGKCHVGAKQLKAKTEAGLIWTTFVNLHTGYRFIANNQTNMLQSDT